MNIHAKIDLEVYFVLGHMIVKFPLPSKDFDKSIILYCPWSVIHSVSFSDVMYDVKNYNGNLGVIIRNIIPSDEHYYKVFEKRGIFLTGNPSAIAKVKLRCA